jgi:hypothetical protein
MPGIFAVRLWVLSLVVRKRFRTGSLLFPSVMAEDKSAQGRKRKTAGPGKNASAIIGTQPKGWVE